MRLAWVTLGVGLLASVVVALHVRQGMEQDAVRHFAFDCDQVALKVRERLGAYALILRGGAALFAASTRVDRNAWRAYVETLRASRSVPGVQGIGFAEVIRPEELAAHLERIRGEGFADYSIRPPGRRALYTSIIYLEPFRDRNLRAFGFDMYAEPVRRAAMDQARDTGVATLSGKVELVQETGSQVQAETLMYVPVYRNGAPAQTLEQRRAALLGWAYSPYRMDDLMTGILGDWGSHEGKGVDLTIYDGREAAPAALLFDSQPDGAPAGHSPFHQQRTLDFNGRPWLLVFDRTASAPGSGDAPALVTLAGGLTLTGLVFWLMLAVINTRTNAERIAGRLTEEIRRHEASLREGEAFTLAILNAVPAEIAVVGRDGVILAVNEPWRRFAVENGNEPGSSARHTDVGINYLDVCGTGTGFSEQDDGASADAGIRAVLDGRLPGFTLEYPCHSPTQSRWFMMIVTPLGGDTGAGAVITRTDITERKQAAAAIDEAQTLLLTIIDTAPIRVFWKDRNLRYLGCNPAFAKDAGVAHPRDVIGKDDYQLGWVAQADLYRADDRSVMASGSSKLSYDEQQTSSRGQTMWVRKSKVALRDRNHAVFGLLGIYEDITERKQAEEKVQLAANVFTHAWEGIMITAADGTIIDVNDAFSRITSYSRDEVLGRNPRLLSSGRQDQAFYAAMWDSLTERGQWSGEIWNRRNNGEVYAVMQTISAVPDAQGNTRQYVTLLSDITLIKEQERALQHLAHYDALTGLPNRVLLADRLHQGMVQAQRYGRLFAVAFLDLDGFKAINDQHGHAAGDQLLIAAAAAMQQVLREGDTLARIGGDEFVAVLLDLADIQTSVPLLARLLAAAAQAVPVDGQVLRASASVGVTFYPQADDIDPEQLLRQADQAMYQAKLAGKNRYHVFDAALDRRVRHYHESIERIRGALDAGEFVLHYQPKVNMRTGAVIGVEALIRWQHPESGLLLPAAFLPVIEDHPLAVEVGEWVIATALRQMEHWQAVGLKTPVSVNVGARQLQQPDFVERLGALLAAHPHVKPGDLELEVLETSALADLARVSQVIEACRGIGVPCALDDFGTGYASLTYLKRLPVIQIKIDQSFVRDMLDDPDDLAILDSVIDLCVAFRRQLIAEGVETLEQGEMLLKLGCELAQGYGIAPPMPAAAIPTWAATWRPHPTWLDLAPVSRDAVPLLFAGAAHRAWMVAVEGYLRGEREVPPPLDGYQCGFGIWLDADGRGRYGTRPAFQSIQALHQRVHALVVVLCELRGQGRGLEVSAGLEELRGLQAAVLEQLKTLVQANPA
ncbi:EAL domain-containing protein [uncultured Thiodictyon sp.]|uniref:EAL domain-containing protein n=1 Tax=uncultured Thiodictyon sp. TaxID=1846217 RepID=UPI0025E07CD9|nr:EAL domain-containing protein [uncultured Thiodictyon sp.]